MFERFTQTARDVVSGAQEEARRFGHGYVGAEHLLAAMMAQGSGPAYGALSAAGLTADAVRTEIVRRIGGPGRLSEGDAEALRTIGIDLDAVVASVERSFGPGALTTPEPAKRGHLPFTKRGKKVLELALREALRLGHSYIGSEHLLLGLIREHDGLAMQILRDRGTDLNVIRASLDAAMPPGRPEKARAGLGAGAHHIVETAQAEARRAGRRYTGTGDLLFALASLATEYDAGPNGKAVAKLLIESGLSPDRIRASVVDARGEAGPPTIRGLKLRAASSKDAKAALAHATRLSLAERRVETDPEFILLALAMKAGSTAATMLLAKGLTPKVIRDRLLPPPPSGVPVAA